MTGSDFIENVALRKRVSELEDKVAQLCAREATSGSPSVPMADPGLAGSADGSDLVGSAEVTGSRRHLLKMAGATVIGAVAATLLDASPAAAITGTMMYGTVNDSLLDPTTLIASSTSQTLVLINNSSGTGLLVTDDDIGTGPPLMSQVVTPTNPNPAITGDSSGTGPGVFGTSTSSYGVHAFGGLAPLWLEPATATGAPTSGAHQPGELYVDSVGVFYKCVTAGTPGVWVPLYSVVPLPAPVRVLNTTSGLGGITGPLVPGSTVHTTSVLTGSNGIPSGAVGVVGNLAVSGVNGALLNGYGVMTIYPAGGTVPATANINAGAGCFAISNSVTVALGTGANAGKLSLVWDGGGPVPNAQAFLDIAGYLL